MARDLDVSSAPLLGPLLRKAAIDAGFDLEPERDGDWWQLRSAGLRGVAWIRPDGAGADLALPLATQLAELDLPSSSSPLPAGAGGGVACVSPAVLYAALRRVRVLLAQAPSRLRDQLEAKIAAITTTEVEAVVKQRVGQELFRDALIAYWEGRCAVTGLAMPALLRASHAKPWKVANDTERLDVHNGLLLAVHLDALFDQGLLTFDATGRGVFSRQVSPDVLIQLGLTPAGLVLRFVRPSHQPYLAYHRENVFRS